MRQKLDPNDTGRAEAFRLWMSSPMPMVTLTKTMDVTRPVRYSRRHGLRFNMLMCWCIGQAASRKDEFLLLPEKDGMFRYDSLSVNVIVPNSRGGISSCDIPVSGSLSDFSEDYLRLTRAAASECRSSFLNDTMVIGTSAMTATELDSITNQYTDQFSNPMLMWGRYRKGWFRYSLPVSFQFHHVQMDGMQAAEFLEEIQRSMDSL